MKEVMQISDKITVLRRGQTITTVNAKDYSPQELANLMVGEKLLPELMRRSMLIRMTN